MSALARRAFTSAPPAATPGGSSGTGLVHTTAGVQDAAAYLGTALQLVRVNALGTDTEWITVLPAASVTQATGTGIPHVALGVLQAASSLIVNADVNAAAAIAGTKVAPDFGSQNVVTTGAVTAGGKITVTSNALGSLGMLSMPYNGGLSNPIIAQKDSIGNPSPVLVTVGDSYIQIGAASNWSSVYLLAGTAVSFGNSSATPTLNVTGSLVTIKSPLIGDGVASPYAANGAVTMASTTGSLTAAQYKYDEIVFTGTPGATQTKTLPNPATLAAGYSKKFRNASDSSVIVTTGAGATVTIPTLQSCTVGFENSNCYAIGAIAAY